MTIGVLLSYHPIPFGFVVMFKHKDTFLYRYRLILGELLLASLAVSSILLFSPLKSKAPALTYSTPTAEETMSIKSEWVSELPVRLIIPSIKVDAEVQHVGLAENGTGEMAVPSNYTDVGWYQPGTRPGMIGSAVIAGHYNGKTVPEAVFYDLHTLEVGDEVVIMSAERIEDIYHVVRVETYDYDASTTDIFLSTDDKVRLNLITCSGEWLPEEKLYNKRTVVFTERMTNVE